MLKFVLAILLFCSTISAATKQPIILTTSNTVVFRGAVTPSSVIKAQAALVEAVLKRNYKDYPIYLVFDSPGGSVDAGLSFLAFAKTIKNLHTITIEAASMAAFSVESLPGKRYITEDGWLMFHRARGEFGGQFEVGEVESRLNMAKKLIYRMEQKVAKRLGISVEDYKAKAKDEWWLDSEDAIKAKAADEVVDIVCTPTLIKSRISEQFFTIFGVSTVEYSGCPLFRYSMQGE